MPTSDIQSSNVQDLIDLLEVARLVVSTLEMDQVLEAILKSAMKLTDTSAGSIALYKKDTQELELHAHRGLSQDFIGNTVWRVRPGGLTDRILKSNKPTVINDTTNKKFFTNPLALKEGIKSIVCVPLAFKDDIIGILYVDDFSPRKFEKSQLNLLSILSSFAAMSIDHARLHENTRKMAFTDGLTGLYNHRHFQEQLEKEISRSSRHKETFSLLMIDIDDFKCINDKFGHTFGDKVLQKLADIFTASIRDSDTPARYGGEEFAVILPRVASEQASLMAQRIRKQVKIKSASLMRKKAPLTISVGVAEYPKDATKRLDLIKRADKALYKAKRLGKDQVVQFHDLERPDVV